ncbi:unnamed protein product [Polarella glacialis]|uniref:Uncharacterized protein n=1 Tax=Polarella glacialis TaxID=89957 RepID=A0A813E9M1_POLGL|nr:unnamed protein product [Polarella glacialis]CAE8710030.1 unnamed protein product [Polarella glacialis]
MALALQASLFASPRAVPPAPAASRASPVLCHRFRVSDRATIPSSVGTAAAVAAASSAVLARPRLIGRAGAARWRVSCAAKTTAPTTAPTTQAPTTTATSETATPTRASAPTGAAVAASFEERFLARQEAARGGDAVPDRPRYLGCTESAEVRQATSRALLRTWSERSGGGACDSAHEFWMVVGGLTGLDSLCAMARSQIEVQKLVLFDCDPLQLSYGELMLALVGICPNRESFVRALFGRSMAAWGRLVGASNMLDFLDLPVMPEVEQEMTAGLPPKLRGLYATVFGCIARQESWPLAWPSFGQSEKLPKSRRGAVQLSNAQRRLGGGRNEAFHINEAGWLKDEASYAFVRNTLTSLDACKGGLELRLLNLGDMKPSHNGCRRVLFISNIDGSPQFLDGVALESLRQSLRGLGGQASAKVDGGGEASSGGTLLLSTRRAEWLSSSGSASQNSG